MKLTTIHITFLLGDKRLNAAMKSLDLCPDYKAYFTSSFDATLTTKTKVDNNYFFRFIDKEIELNDKKMLIVGIIHNNIIYTNKKILSDGKQELLL